MGATIDGQILTKISGESVFVYISGGTVLTSVSGNVVSTSVSGNTVIAKMSGETVVTTVSGNAVFAYISGGTVLTSVSGNVITLSSGTTYLASGQAVSVSGNVVSTSASGNAVFAYISGGTVASTLGISGHMVNVSGNAAIAISSVITTAGTYLEWISLHMTSGAITSSEFYATVRQISSVAFLTKLVSVNPAANTVFDVLYQPDNRLLLLSGAVITVNYSNPNSLNYGCVIMFSD